MKNSTLVQKLAIGTVQFGIDYGISNQEGQVSIEEAHRILSFALSRGVTKVDTASAYGNSEEVIGKYSNSKGLDIITKVPPLTSLDEASNFSEKVLKSFELLNLSSVYGLMTHDESDLFTSNGVYKHLEALKSEGKIEKIGSSFYTTQALRKALDEVELDIIQIPLSIFDQRFNDAELLSEVKKRGIEVHVRSIFLQGLVFMNEKTIPEFFNPVLSKFKSLWALMKQQNLTPLDVCYSYLNSVKEVDHFVVGFTNQSQLEQTISTLDNLAVVDCDFSNFDLGDDKFRLPVNWSSK
jgi:aryl-alcohol dehydrogenase-like predicted oxidoreductase